ncbi:MAG: thiamine pyrophosphate-dependent enzyme, partial [Weeksellaceae bacterium]
LKQAGVKRIYAVTGDSLNPVNDAIRRDGEIEWIHVRHEEVGAYAASMEAELNGIGCCMGSSGPGHVHLINGLYDANRSGNPVIAIASTIHTNKLGTDNFQETQPTLLFQDCSKYVHMANTPAQFTQVMQHAIQVAKSERGVAVVGLPGDVASAEAVEVPTSSISYKTKAIYRPHEDSLRELADIINNNDKISLYCGLGAKDAVKEVEELARKLNAPISYSFRGKIFFDKEDSPYTVGMNGLLGNPAGYHANHDADVMVMLGTDFPYTDFMPTDNKIVQIDDNPHKIGRRAKVDYAYEGDIKDTIEALLPFIKEKEDDSFLKKYKNAYEKDLKSYAVSTEEKSEKDHVSPEAAAHVINELAAEDAIFTVDTGMSAVWAARLIKAKKNRYLTGSFNHGSMANAMPMAIGAVHAEKDRQVVAMCGDGGLSMLMGDLATIMQYQLPIKIIVFNNRSLGMVKLEMEVAGYVDWNTNMVNPPFHKIAELMDIKGIAIRHNDELIDGLKEAFAHDGPVLVNIFTDPEVLAMPPKVTFDQMKGFAESFTKKVFTGRIEDAGDMVKAGIDAIT